MPAATAATTSCRTFVVVDTGDVTYSARASVLGYPEVTGTVVFRLSEFTRPLFGGC